MITVDTITDEQIRVLRDGEVGLLDESIRDLCRIALQNGSATNKRPFCRVCSWRKGGADSWDGRACKCGLSSLPYFTCDVCHGLGTVPYDIGSQPCPSCDGSGLIEPGARVLARARCAEILNARMSPQ
jgi:hypothetical protein